MKTIIHYFTVPAMIALFLLWKVAGIDGAGNVFQVLFWFIYPIAAVGACINLASTEKMSDELRGHYFENPWFNRLTALCMFSITAWFGHLGMAALVLLNMSLGMAVRGKLLEQHKTA